MTKKLEPLTVCQCSHFVRTFDGRQLFNLNDGTLYDRDSKVSITLSSIFPKIRCVFGSDGRLIAKRRRQREGLYTITPRKLQN